MHLCYSRIANSATPRTAPAGRKTAGVAYKPRRFKTARGLGSALLPREEAVELVGEALAVRVVERCGAAGALPRAAQLVQVVAQREALLDVLRGIELAARVERVAALGDHVGGERDVRGDDQVAGRELAHDVAVRDVDAARHLEGADVRRGRRAP